MAKQLPPESSKRAAAPHLKHAAIKGAANLLRKHGHIGQVLHADIVKHADRGMSKAKRQ